MPETVLEKIAQGETSAVQACLAQYGGLVWSLARKCLQNAADVEDAVQEIFVDVWKNAAKFDSSLASETTFIAMIARRRLIDRQRKLARSPEVNSLNETENSSTSCAYPDEILEIQEEARRARDHLNQLRPEEKQVLELSIDQGMSQSQIADLTGIPLGSVKTYARRGMIRLRELLQVSDERRLKGAAS